MSETKDTRKRFALGPLYATEEIVSKVNSIPEIAGAVTGSDKVVAIIRSFDFYHEWKDKVSNLNSASNEADLARISDLESKVQQLTDANEMNNHALDLKISEIEEKDAKIAELESKVQQLENEAPDAAALNDRIAELEAEISQLQSAATEWPKIASSIDPVYAAMAEEVARMLSTDDDPVNPMRVMIDIFAKYHIFRYTELPFQPFIDEKVLNEIINKNYPELGGLRGLRKRLV